MSLDKILKRRALRLKAELTEGDRPKPSFLSTIYPAMDYGENSPHVVKTPASVPSSNDADAEEPEQGPEKGEKEVDEPGPSKTTSASLPVIPGQTAMVPEAHKKAALELGYFGENRSEQFIKRCVELITGVKKLEQEDPTEGGDVDVPGGGCPAASPGPEGSPGDAARSKLSALAKKFTKTKDSYG